ncbi:MAG: LuxR family transcriptional regulator [Pseudomonadota bacterium]
MTEFDLTQSEAGRTLKVIEDIDQQEDKDGVLKILANYTGHFGFSRIMVGQFVNPAIVDPCKIMVVTDWPEELLKLRARRPDRFIRDPVGQYALRSKRPFYWSEAYKHASRAGQAMLDEAREFGMLDGIMFPVHAFDRVPGGISFSADEVDVSPEQIGHIELVSMHAYTRLDTLLGPFPYHVKATLTEREVDVIYFAAGGKTNWEIGQILGITEYTVRDHLKRVQTKLATSNRAHTVAVAIAQSHIWR